MVHSFIEYDRVQSYVARHPGETRLGVALTAVLAVPGREVLVIKELQSASLCPRENDFSLKVTSAISPRWMMGIEVSPDNDGVPRKSLAQVDHSASFRGCSTRHYLPIAG